MTVTEFTDAIKGLRETLDNTPGASEIFAGLESGDLTPAQAYLQLETLLSGAGHDLGALGNQFPMAIPMDGAVPMVLEGDNGLPMLNPLVEAAIAELASIDGDVPHMRSGPMPATATPAIPVETTAANPVMVGMMLKDAADKVQEALQLAVAERDAQIKAITERAQEAGLVVRKEDLPAPITGVAQYRAGQVPAALVVAQPTAQQVAGLTPTQQREAVHKALATTQGRSSLAPVIASMVRARLGAMGVDAVVGNVSEDGLSAMWAMNTYADDEIHEDFSPVEVAAGSLAAKIKKHLFKKVVFTVVPFNGTSERHFGWGVRFQEET